MKLSKAIEIKETYLKGDEAVEHDELIEADWLSLEALKLKQKLNTWSWHWHEQLLPGETEE